MAKDGGIEYGVVGCSMGEILTALVAFFVGPFKRGRRPRAVMLWGPPGVGKTYTTYAAARAIGKILGRTVEVYCMPTSCLEPTDVAGVPTPREIDGITQYTSYLPPKWAWETSIEFEESMRRSDPTYKAPPAILLFDDIVAAHFQTQTAFFKGVHEGMWGDLHQRDNVMVIACGNRVEDNAGANDMPTALANRFCHLYAKPTTDGWIEWAQNDGNIHPYVVGYIRSNKSHLNEFDEDVANRADKAFASARTWEALSDFLWEGEIDRENDQIFHKVVMGIIGRGIATQFMAFLRNTVAVIPPEEIVKNPKRARIPNRKNIDALHATISSLEHHIHENPKHWKAAVTYACREEMVSDFGVLLANTIVKVISTKLDAETRADAMDSPEFETFFERFQDTLDFGI